LNNGLAENYNDNGRERTTHLNSDLATFKVPTLRNIALTSPYMHDGSLVNLESVIEHYAKGGFNHANKSELIQPFKISERNKKDLINFLNSLTDYEFVTDSSLTNPFN
jgi:cytochrome c peroxidase